MNPQRRNTVFMILVSLVFLGLPFILSIRPPEEDQFSITRPIIRDIITNAILLFTFYLNYFILIPKLYFRKRYIIYAAAILTMFFASCLLPSLLTDRLSWPHMASLSRRPPSGIPHRPPPDKRNDQQGPPPDFDRQGPPNLSGPPDRTTPSMTEQNAPVSYFLLEIRHSLYLFVAVLLLSLLLRIRERLYTFQSEKISAELTSLKAQINPHFLFNSLNTLHAFSVSGDQRMSSAIVHLAGMLRYILKDAMADKIALQTELDYITHYVELQKVRVSNATNIGLMITGSAAHLDIAPLMLITFIENAFKYGVNPDEPSTITIDISIKEDQLDLQVVNDKVQNKFREDALGIGLENTRQRLELMYRKKHKLDIADTAQKFSVNLSIQLA